MSPRGKLFVNGLDAPSFRERDRVFSRVVPPRIEGVHRMEACLRRWVMSVGGRVTTHREMNMPSDAGILEVLFATVDELNKELPPEQRLTKSEDTIVFGHAGKLDSLGLVNFLVTAEQRLQDRFGVTIALADERAMSQERSPFRTLATMADYVQKLLTEKGEVRSPAVGESSSQAHARESAGI